jgi:hypothetical protein
MDGTTSKPAPVAVSIPTASPGEDGGQKDTAAVSISSATTSENGGESGGKYLIVTANLSRD